MARNFNNANDRLSADALTPTWSVPWTYMIWGRESSLGGLNTAFATGEAIGSSSNRTAIRWAGSFGGDPIVYLRENGGTDNIVTTTGYSSNVYACAMVVSIANDDAAVYIDGGSKGTGVVERILAAQAAVSIGVRMNGGEVFDGPLAYAAMFDRAFNDAEARAAALGIHPWRMGKQHTIAMWPILGLDSPEPDWGPNGFSLTVTNSPDFSALNPPVMPFRTRRAAA